VGFAVAAFAVALVVLIWVVVINFAQRERIQTINAEMRANAKLARAFEEHAVRTLAQATQLAVVIRRQYAAQGSRFDLVQFFRDTQVDPELVQDALIADESGRTVASSKPGLVATSIADREHFKAHIAQDTGKLYISKPVLTRIAKRWSIVVSLRLNKPDGAFGGTVGIALDPAYFSRFYQQMDLGANGVVNLIGLDGVIRARSAGELIMAGQDIRGGEIFRQLESSPQGSYIAEAKVDGVRRIQSYRKLADYPLVISVGVAESVALADYQTHHNLYFLSAILATLLILAAATVIYRTTVRQQRTANQLWNSGNRLIEAQELAGIISLEWLVDVDQVDWSRSPEFLLGPKPEGGYPVYREMVHPEDRQAWLDDRQAALDARGTRHYADYRLIRTDGEQRWVSCTQRASGAGAARKATFTLLDITERKHAEFALAESERQLRALSQNLEQRVALRADEIRARESLLRMVTENVPAMIAYFDADRRVRFANTSYARLRGFPDVESMIGQTATALTPPETAMLHDPHYDKAYAGAVHSYEFPLWREPSRWFEQTLVPDVGNGGTVQGVFTLLIEITERRLAHEQLQTAVSLLTATLEATADGILVVAADKKIARFNQRFVEMWGIPREIIDSRDDDRALGYVLGQLADPDAFIGKVEALYAEPLKESFDEVHFKDGRVFERYSCPQIVAGAPEGRVWSFRDVTQRITAEVSLRAADERYRLVVTNMAEGVIVRDRNGRIIDCNASAERLTGHSLAQMRGETSVVKGWRVIHEDGSEVPPQERSAMKALRTGQLQTDMVMGYCDPDGPIRWMSSTSQPLFDGADPTPSGVFTTITDVSLRKLAEAERDRLEALLRESQKMEAMGTLAGGIAHDFNNILGAILGNVALARDDLGPDHPAVASIEEIRKASERAKHLVLQILAFSRKQPQHFIDQPLQRVIEDTLGLLRSTLPAGVEIDASVDAAPLSVRADATQIGQVLMNLCTNAWHAVTRNGGGKAGRISVGLDRVEIDTAAALRFGAVAPGKYARLTVGDNGPGMDAAIQARIFEPFFTTKPFGEGTGLGLAVVHGIVKAHGGAIAVTSAPGTGTRFEVILPTSDTQPAPALAPPASPLPAAPASANRHVMYVDDEPSMVFLVTRMLKKLGYRVSPFERPEAALAAVRADPAGFDVVVSDFNMPGLSGLDVAREVLQIRADLPVVIASGYITEELRAGAARLGVKQLIYKPNTVDELCQAIARVLESTGR
jgi:PAS domain S-box-containing protein